MKAEAIVLAAGAGRRFGGGKLLAQYRGQPLLTWSLRTALRSPVERVILVVAPDGQAVAEAARAFEGALADAPPLEVVVAPDAAEGMGASLRAGVAAASPHAGLVVFLADMPRIEVAVVEALLAAIKEGAPAAAPVCDDRRGHPVAFAPALREALLKVGGDAGARDVLRRLGDRLVLAPADEGVLFDVDRPEDLLDE